MTRMASLKRILIFNFLVVALFPLLVSGLFAYRSLSASMEEEIKRKNQVLADSVARELGSFLDEPLRLLLEIQTLLDGGGVVAEQHIKAHLKTVLHHHRVFDMIMVLDNEGKVMHLSPYDDNLVGIDMSYQKYYLAQQKEKQPQWSKTFISAKTGRPTLTLTVPFENGMTVGFLDLNYLETITQKVRLGEMGYVAICDSDGTTIAHINKSFVAERLNVKYLDLIREGLKGNPGTYRYHFRGVDKIGSVAIVPQTAWVVAITQPMGEAFAPVRHIQHILLGGMLSAIVFAILAAYISQRMALRPLSELTEDTKRIATGDYSSPLKPPTYQEMAVLEESFLKMLDALKSRENALRESESRFRTLVNNVPGVVYRCVYDKDWTMDYISDQVEAISGYPATDFICNQMRSYFSIIHPDDNGMIDRVVSEAVRQRAPFVLEYRILHASGGVRWVFEKGQAIYDSSGDVLFLDGVIMDCTEQKIAEQALLESEEKLRITLNSIGDAVIATDVDGRVERMNPVAERLTGWNSSEAIGGLFDQIFQIVDQNTGQAIPDLVSSVVEHGEVVGLPPNTIMISKDGAERSIADSGSPIRNEKGEIVGAVLVFRDITEQSLLESRIRQSEKMESIGRLAGGVAHDFNNMLGGIMGAADLLALQVRGDQKAERHVSTILQAAERVADLTGKLLAFSHKGKFVSKAFDLHGVIEDAVDILSHSLDKRVQIELDLAAEKAVIVGDKSQLQNAIINLGVNAGDAMPKGGSLILSTADVYLDTAYCERSVFPIQPGMHVKLSVQDTGVGMDDEVLAKIFEPFFTTKKEGAGTGLGLPAVYGTVKEHAGAIYVYSEVGHGSEFHLYFPLVNETTDTEKMESISFREASGTVLVVDDEDVIRGTAVSMLEELGYTVLTAEDGAQALRVYRDEYPKIDLVLLDMVMPNMNGPEAFREIRAFDPSAKILVSSGFTKNKAVDELKGEGAIGFVKKPYRYTALAEIIARALTS